MKKLKILLLFVLFINSTLKSQDYFVENVNISFWKIEFINPNIGYGVTSSAPNSSSSDIKLYKTTDKGISWIEKYAFNSTSGLVDLSVVSENIVFITNANKILKSVNGGTSFAEMEPFSGGVSLMIDFFDENNGIVFINTNGPNPNIHHLRKTTNGGTSWSNVYQFTVHAKFISIRDLKFGNNVNEFSGVGGLLNDSWPGKKGMVFLKTTNGGTNLDESLYTSRDKYCF